MLELVTPFDVTVDLTPLVFGLLEFGVPVCVVFNVDAGVVDVVIFEFPVTMKIAFALAPEESVTWIVIGSGCASGGIDKVPEIPPKSVIVKEFSGDSSRFVPPIDIEMLPCAPPPLISISVPAGPEVGFIVRYSDDPHG